MAKLGSASSNEFSIGTAEVRVGPLTEAGRLAQARSVGLVDNVTISFATASVDLKGGFPQQIVDTAITEQTGSIKVTAREFSRRNLDLMLGNAISAAAVDAKSKLVNTANVAAAATSLTLVTGGGASFDVDDVIVIYPEGRPEDVTVSQISAISTDTLTLKTGMGTVVAYNALTESTLDFHVFKAHGIAAGNVTRTNYFSVMLLQQKNNTGRPAIWTIWKAANSGSMEQGTSATDYASLSMEMKILQPTLSDVGVGGDLNNMASLISMYPSAARFAGADG